LLVRRAEGVVLEHGALLVIRHSPIVGDDVERLWTPWRLEFVTNVENAPDCFLCVKPAAGRDAENLIVLRGVRAYALLNLFPYNTAHTLIAPFEHVGDFGTLDAATAEELTAMTQRLVRALTVEYRPQGFNIGMNLGRAAGAGVPDHLHVHVVPRWGGDTNFMPVTAGTKVLPETLDRTYQRLHARLSSDV
jgi:ATP adenylyltransferase